MTSHHRYQLALGTGAATAGFCATIAARRGDPWAAGLLAAMAVWFAGAGLHEACAYRRGRLRAARWAEIAARPPDDRLPLLEPCCQFWASTAGRVHAPRCPVGNTHGAVRAPEGRTGARPTPRPPDAPKAATRPHSPSVTPADTDH